MAALALDKKRLETGVPFVLLPRLGEAVVREEVPMAAGARGFSRDYVSHDPAGTGAGSNTDLLFDWAGVWPQAPLLEPQGGKMTEAKSFFRCSPSGR